MKSVAMRESPLRLGLGSGESQHQYHAAIRATVGVNRYLRRDDAAPSSTVVSEERKGFDPPREALRMCGNRKLSMPKDSGRRASKQWR
jgi:hypothetical protein